MKFSDLNLLDFGNEVQFAAAVYVGKGETYVLWFPNEEPDQSAGNMAAHIFMSSDDWKKLLLQTDVMETEILQRAADGTVTKAIVRKSQRQIDQVLMWRVYRRDCFTCRYCGANDVPLTVDHVVCWESGGPTTEENLLTSCKKCNRRRGNTPYDEWLSGAYYQAASANLPYRVRQENLGVIERIHEIPRLVHSRSR